MLVPVWNSPWQQHVGTYYFSSTFMKTDPWKEKEDTNKDIRWYWFSVKFWMSTQLVAYTMCSIVMFEYKSYTYYRC